MPKKLEYYTGLVSEVFEDRGVMEQIARFEKIDKMLSCVYENPKELQALPWIKDRKFVTTAPADAANAATRAFASREPILSVQPLAANDAEYARVERIETALMWEFQRMNMVGKKPVHWQVVESAMRYCKVALQTEYLPFAFKEMDKDKRLKAILRTKKYNWTIHHPGTVFAMDGPYGVYEFVVKKCQYSVKYLRDKFGEKNTGVRKMFADLEDKQDPAEILSTEVWYFDVFDWDNRIQWASLSEDGDEYEFRNEEHRLPFIPWVVVDNADPILKSVVDAELWENANAIRTITFSKAVDMAAHPELWIQTATGDLTGVHIDNTNPSQPIVTDSTADVQQLRPPQMDQQLANVQQMSQSEIFQSSVAQILASVQELGNTSTFSTANAMLQAALTQLALAQNAAERAEQMAFEQMLNWIDFTDIPLVVYREKSKNVNGASYQNGQEIMIQKAGKDIPDDMLGNVAEFDPEYLYLGVKLQSINITDKQAEQTIAINDVERLGASYEEVYERMGMGDYAVHQSKRRKEDIANARKQAAMQRELAAVEIETQQKMAEMQMQQQAAAEQAALQSRGAGQFAGAQGVDPRSGGNPATRSAPMSGREQLSGQSKAGQGLA